MNAALRQLVAPTILLLAISGAGASAAQPAPADPSSAAPAATTSASPAAPAATTGASPAAPAADPAQAPAPAEAPGGRVAPPPEGKGQVVFFRPSRFVGAAVSFSIHEGDTGVGKLGNGSYFVLVADPGPHEYSIQFEAKDTLHLEVEPGETYYVQQTIGMGVVAARPHLTPSEKVTFEGLNLKVSNKKPSDLKPKADKADN